MVEAGSPAQIAQMHKGVLGYCVMALVEDEERYGFELVHELTAVRGLSGSEGTMYPLLSRLRRDGFVETTWRESTSGPPRRYYRLTPAGKHTLQEFRQEWQRFSAAVDQLLKPGGAK